MSKRRSLRERVKGRASRVKTAVTREIAARAPLPTNAALIKLATQQAGALVDRAASRWLASDEDAAQLAYIVEKCAEEHGREAVLSVVLRQNLWLNGTFLKLIEPALRGQAVTSLDPRVLNDGRRTLLRLLVEVAAPDDEPAASDESALWQQYLERTAALPTDRVTPHLQGDSTEEALAGFLLGSYTVFLQSFLLRTSVQLLPALAEQSDRASATRVLEESDTEGN
ncbi:MAG: hypothetical protein ACI81R_002172 [Bradymonadia bacterium]|jgi:hypothetical protein